MNGYIITAIILLPLTAAAQDKIKKVKCTVTDAVTAKPIKGMYAYEHGKEDTLWGTANGTFQVSTIDIIQMGVSAPGYEEQHILVTPDGKCVVQLRKEEDAEEEETDTEE